jgi:hypothetical protein
MLVRRSAHPTFRESKMDAKTDNELKTRLRCTRKMTIHLLKKNNDFGSGAIELGLYIFRFILFRLQKRFMVCLHLLQQL